MRQWMPPLYYCIILCYYFIYCMQAEGGMRDSAAVVLLCNVMLSYDIIYYRQARLAPLYYCVILYHIVSYHIYRRRAASACKWRHCITVFYYILCYYFISYIIYRRRAASACYVAPLCHYIIIFISYDKLYYIRAEGGAPVDAAVYIISYYITILYIRRACRCRRCRRARPRRPRGSP